MNIIYILGDTLKVSDRDEHTSLKTMSQIVIFQKNRHERRQKGTSDFNQVIKGYN